MWKKYKYFSRVPKILFWKIKYGNNANIAIKQRYGRKFEINLIRGGRITLERDIFTRNNDYILVDGGHLKMGKNIFLNNNVSITCLDCIELGEGCTIANNVVIVDHDHNEGGFETKPIKIGRNVWIGANAVILKGVNIGDNAIVAAGSIVTKDIESNTLVAGVPAKVLKTL